MINKQSGLTLIEIMVSLVILALVAGSIFSAFSGSRSMLSSAREISMATSLASSYLAAARNIAVTNLKAFAPIKDALAPVAFRPETLGLAIVPENFKREISVLRLDLSGKEGGPFFQIRVDIKWPGKDGKIEVCYGSSIVVKGAGK